MPEVHPVYQFNSIPDEIQHSCIIPHAYINLTADDTSPICQEFGFKKFFLQNDLNSGHSGEKVRYTLLCKVNITSRKEPIMPFDDAIEEFFHARIEQIETEDPVISQFSDHANSILIQLYDKILNTIPEEYLPLVAEYEKTASSLEVEWIQLFYKQGVRDGLALGRKIETICNAGCIQEGTAD